MSYIVNSDKQLHFSIIVVTVVENQDPSDTVGSILAEGKVVKCDSSEIKQENEMNNVTKRVGGKYFI